jgi:predicted metal-dependent peptidase
VSPANDSFRAIDQVARRQEQTERAAKALTSARTRLILGPDATSAFFATLALRLTLVADETRETMATDGVSLRYSPAFVTGLSPDELLGVLAHEVLHNALAPPFRRAGRDRSRWNVACDLAANPLLLKVGFQLPEGRLVPGEGRYTELPVGLSAEEYYARLSQAATDEESCPGDPGGCGSVTDPTDEAECPSGAEALAAEWQVALVQAEQAARGKGKLPAGLRRAVQQIVNPPADWRDLLREFVSSQARNDYSWSRPNRRFVAQGLYLPGLHSEELGDVLLAVDTSGSVDERMLGVFAGELNAILASFDCTLWVLYHDTEVQLAREWRSTDGPLALEPIGGGGTAHACVFDWIQQSGCSPRCVICLTDLDTEFPAPAPDLPVLWAVLGDNRSEPPFGRRVDLNP